MVIILGTITLETAADYEGVEAELVRRAARSRADPGNIDYAFSRSIEDPAVIRLTEIWEDEQSLNAHLQIPDAAFAAVLANTRIASARVTSYAASGQRELMER